MTRLMTWARRASKPSPWQRRVVQSAVFAMLLSAHAATRVRAAETCQDGPREGWDIVVVETTPAFYTLARCNASTATDGPGWAGTATPFNATKHAGVVAKINLQSCNLGCLRGDAFDFPGASNVTELSMNANPIERLPEQLLRNLTSLQVFSSRGLANLQTLPESFFRGLGGTLTKMELQGAPSFGAVEALPDGLLRGLTKLESLAFSGAPFGNLPSLDDLKSLVNALLTAGTVRSRFVMDETESESKFDGLVGLEALILQGHSITRLPSVKNMKKMLSMLMSSNLITTIAVGDFKGAESLVAIDLGNNKITSVAVEAFLNLLALNCTAQNFKPENDDGSTPFLVDSPAPGAGVELWPHAGVGFFGGGSNWAYPPLSFAPNPTQCKWVGPNMNQFDCGACGLGYETTSATNAKCVFPPKFSVHKGWVNSREQTQLTPQEARGSDAERSADDTLVLRTGHTYKFPAPPLEPKEAKFAGYEQPHTKIHYELDFMLGADVDLGCGTSVVGNGLSDPFIPETDHTHPLSMRAFSTQIFFYPGKFGHPCPRYHRFTVTSPGNFTFDTCSSIMVTGFAVLKRTTNMSQSEPRKNSSDWQNCVGDGCRTYDVPLFMRQGDERRGTVRTGLVQIQPDYLGPGFVGILDFFKQSPGLPRVDFPNTSRFPASNGCPLSLGAHRTYYLDTGDYFLETTPANPNTKCNHFEVKMECGAGAATASPQSDPLGFLVDAKTGAITGSPEQVRDGYRMRLRAVDAANKRTTVKEWTFDVEDPPTFRLNPDANWTAAVDGTLARKYHIAETHLLDKPRLKKEQLLQHPAGGDFDAVVYLLSAKTVDGNNSSCAVDATNETQVVSALTDVATGAGAMNIRCEGNYTARLVVRDGGGDEVVLRDWTFEVLRRDTDVPEYGPGGEGCTNGAAVDGDAMDRKFTCDCSATRFKGANCGTEESTNSDENDTTLYVIGAVFAVLVLGAIVVFLVVRYQRYQRSMMVTDFQAQLEAMKQEGLVDAEISGDRVPRELKRGWLMFIDRLGHGQFGEVWKGLLSDGDNANIPEYMVAAKTVKEADSNETTVANETELMKEALLMAQVEPHPHLVSIIGVITRGRPKTLVLSFCEHGEMGGALKKRAADGDAFDVGTKYRFCSEIAAGMAHLGTHHFIHRDLAARNVLLGSGMVCKVADFGLSRRVQTEDNTGDYYRSTSGVLPVRWTAPEGLTSQKFTTASDVWSFGIVCVEIFQDGVSPYPAIRSNPEVMTFVNNAGVHPQPEGCADEVYGEVRKCFSFDPEARPPFAALNAFFAALAPDDAAGKPSATPPAGGDAQQQHYLTLLHEHTGGDVDVFNELRDAGDIQVDETYSTSEYLQLGAKRRASIAKENSIIGGLDGLQISEKLGQATEDLQKHSSQYHKQFAKWRSHGSLVDLKRLTAEAEAKIKTREDYETMQQPNPWQSAGIEVTSKRYLARVITVYNGTGAKYDVLVDPTGDVVKACSSIVAKLGAGVTLMPGPPKKEQRILEKSRDGNYASVRDLGRLSLIVQDIALVPDVLASLLGCKDFEVVRIKNRLDPGHDAVESAGYRDVQVLVREPRGGWIVEIQVIPNEMYELKKSCGHTGYTKYRFILEACKRAMKVRQAANVFKAGPKKAAGTASVGVQQPLLGALPPLGGSAANATANAKKRGGRNVVYPTDATA